jgi:hypothetical protein
MKQVWVGLLEVTQIPGDQLITLSQGAAFTWFTCWAETSESFELKAIEVMLHYGLHVIAVDEISQASDRLGVEGDLLEQIERTHESETYSLYGTFHGYPPRYC